MKITLNGDLYNLPQAMTVDNLVEHLMLTGKRLAVEINQEIIPKSQYEKLWIQDDDVIEILHAIGGG